MAERKYTIVIDEAQRQMLEHALKEAASKPPYPEALEDLKGMVEHLPQVDTQDGCINDFTL